MILDKGNALVYFLSVFSEVTLYSWKSFRIRWIKCTVFFYFNR